MPNDASYETATEAALHSYTNRRCPSDAAGDLAVDSAKVFTTVLGPLKNNWGATEINALLPVSPARRSTREARLYKCPRGSLTIDQCAPPKMASGMSSVL